MKTLSTPSVQICPVRYSLVAYGSLLIAAAVLFMLKDWQFGFSMLGISLVAMPRSKDRLVKQPQWQRTWFILHFVVLAGAMLYLVLSKF